MTNPDFIYFETQLPLLLKEHHGQFAIVKNQQLHGFYATFESALQQGYEKFGNMDFLVQEITDEKRNNYFYASSLCRD